MTNIKLEVGQVWKSSMGTTHHVLLLYRDKNTNTERVAYYHNSKDHNGVSNDYIASFAKNKTLITNPDGTPHVKPNDYQAGDVWVFYGTSRTPGSAYLIISGRNGLMVLCDYKKDATPMEEMSLIANPINYKLIHRIGVIL